MAEAIRVEKTGQWGPRADVRRSSSQGTALALTAKTTEGRITATGQWEPCADVRQSPKQGVALALAAKTHGIVEAHRVLANLSEEIKEKAVLAL